MTEGQASLAKSLVLLLAGHVSITAGGQHQIWSRKKEKYWGENADKSRVPSHWEDTIVEVNNYTISQNHRLDIMT